MKQKTDYSKEQNKLSISLENFQSISSADLEFVQGINIIVGQSNSGKSAILRALKGVILNPNGSQKYIKNGTKGFKVNVDYNGNTIEWSRGSKSPQYTVNGECYTKVGNAKLADILSDNGFVLDENNCLMNIESELELPFPFDKNNTELFKLFEKNIFCVSDSTAIIKLIKADEDEASRSKDNANYELDRYKQKKQAIEDLEEYIDLDKLVTGRNKLSSAINTAQELKLDIQDICGKIDLGKLLEKEIPEVVKNSNTLQDYLLLVADVSKLNEIKLVGSIYVKSPTVSPKVLHASQYVNLKEDVEQLEKVGKLIGIITDVNTVSPKSINEYISLKDSVRQLENANHLISVLSPLEAPTLNVNNKEYISLRNDVNSLLGLKEQAQRLHNSIQDLQANIKALEEEKSKFKVCPLCGGNLINE